MKNLITVSYDNNKLDYPAITCAVHKRASREGNKIRVIYFGDEAEELYKIVTHQGYLKELLDKKSSVTCKDCAKYDETRVKQWICCNNECEPNEDAAHCCEFVDSTVE